MCVRVCVCVCFGGVFLTCAAFVAVQAELLVIEKEVDDIFQEIQFQMKRDKVLQERNGTMAGGWPALCAAPQLAWQRCTRLVCGAARGPPTHPPPSSASASTSSSLLALCVFVSPTPPSLPLLPVCAEETDGSVMMYSGFSIAVMLVVALWQVSHLNSFLKKVRVL